MKTKKILMLVIIVCSLLIASTSIATAIEESEKITDLPGDVFSLDSLGYSEEEFNYISEHEDIEVDNIDIREVTYERNDKNVEISLEVEGIIEDRGDVNDSLYGDDYETNIDTVFYAFELTTSNKQYTISYVNKECKITIGYNEEEFFLPSSDISVVDKVLTVSFELKTSNETYEDLSASTSYIKFDLSLIPTDPYTDPYSLDDIYVLLSDMAPDIPLSVDAFSTNTAEVGQAVEFEGITYFGQPPYSFEWDFGDSETSNEQNPTHIYDKADTYEYTFTVTDSSGTTDSASYEIEILEADDNDDDTPGFELVIAIAAIGIILFLKRRRYQ